MVNNILRTIREKREIQLKILAKGVGVSRQAIHAIETNRNIPSVELALRISEYLKLPVEEIFQLSKKKNSDRKEISPRKGMTH